MEENEMTSPSLTLRTETRNRVVVGIEWSPENDPNFDRRVEVTIDRSVLTAFLATSIPTTAAESKD